MKKPAITKFERFAEITLAKYERYLPTAFDESLTLLEKMNKLIQYLNEMGLTLDHVVNQWNEVMEWVLNDGITVSVHDKLDEMVADGTLATIINEHIFKELNDKINETETKLERVHDTVNKIVVDPTKAPFNADCTGQTDATAALQKAIDYLSSVNGGTLLIPDGCTFLIKADKPTIDNPKRILIKADNIHIKGRGTIYMSGITKKYIDSLDDYSSSGRDVFTAFSFMGVKNCSVSDVKFKGEWDGEGRFRYASPRAKGIGFTACHDCSVNNIYGENILGNLVNSNDAKVFYDKVSGASKRISIVNSTAYRCLENGFNYMGGTEDCIFENNVSRYNGSTGFESASDGLICSGNILSHNKLGGLSFSGKDEIITDNLIIRNGDGGDYGNGVNFTYAGTQFTGGFKLFTGNIVKENDGFAMFIYPGNNNLEIKNNVFKDNLKIKFNATYNTYIYMLGNASSQITNVRIIDNTFNDNFKNVERFININFARLIDIKNNHFKSVEPIPNALINGDSAYVNIYYNTNNTNFSVSSSATNIFFETNQKTGSMTFSGDGLTGALVIPHGLKVKPKHVTVTSTSDDAGKTGIKYVSYDPTNIYIFPLNNKISGTNNLSYDWLATT